MGGILSLRPTPADAARAFLVGLDVLLDLEPADRRAALDGAMALSEASSVASEAWVEGVQDQIESLRAGAVELRRLLGREDDPGS